jgi:predicted membrane channel-forming protein YqfA (hemolysin III family)
MRKITENMLRNVAIVLFLFMNIIVMFFKNLRYEMFVGFIVIVVILGSYSILTNSKINKRNKIIRICLYLFFLIVSIFVVSRII